MRLKKFALSSYTLTWMLGAGVKCFEVQGNPLPVDATIVNILPSHTHGEVCLVLHSESFEPIEEGKEIPLYGPLTVTTYGKTQQL